MHRKALWTMCCILLGAVAALGGAPAEEVLPNGIVLPKPWPPRHGEPTREPLATPPYLASPPAVIPIDLGRQLLVDDFLVEHTTLTRTYHRAQYHPASPVLRPDKPWEGTGRSARAGVFSDGVWYDPADRLFKAWYWGSRCPGEPTRYDTCYAVSRDGIRWDKPALDVVPGTNVVLRDEPGWRRNSSTVWLDLDETDPQRRLKMFRVVSDVKTNHHHMRLHFSADGIHWNRAGDSKGCGDRSTVFFNPFRNVWVFSLRTGGKEVSRCRRYHEHRDPIVGLRWSDNRVNPDLIWWLSADRLDPDRSDLELRRPADRPWDLVPSQLYNLDAVAYESLMLGLCAIWRGQPLTRPKINEVCLAFSRDGFHWTRPDRRAFCGVSEKKDDWNWGNVQSAGGGCLVVGDKLHFYVGGVSGRQGVWHPDPTSTGLAVLRRDGFASFDAGPQEGTLTTRAVCFRGTRLFVNADAARGRLQVEILDSDGRPIAPFARERCTPLTSDSTLQAVRWGDAEDLSAVAGKPVRFRFHLTEGRLFAFWVSPDATGASHGYVAAGGPGLTGPRDTVGRAAYQAAQAAIRERVGPQLRRRPGADGQQVPLLVPLIADPAAL